MSELLLSGGLALVSQSSGYRRFPFPPQQSVVASRTKRMPWFVREAQ